MYSQPCIALILSPKLATAITCRARLQIKKKKIRLHYEGETIERSFFELPARPRFGAKKVPVWSQNLASFLVPVLGFLFLFLL